MICMSVMPKKFGRAICPPGFGFGRAADFFGRWIRCQRPFPAAVGDDFVLAIFGPPVAH
jgi:hypothetical protein